MTINATHTHTHTSLGGGAKWGSNTSPRQPTSQLFSPARDKKQQTWIFPSRPAMGKTSSSAAMASTSCVAGGCSSTAGPTGSPYSESPASAYKRQSSTPRPAGCSYATKPQRGSRSQSSPYPSSSLRGGGLGAAEETRFVDQNLWSRLGSYKNRPMGRIPSFGADRRRYYPPQGIHPCEADIYPSICGNDRHIHPALSDQPRGGRHQTGIYLRVGTGYLASRLAGKAVAHAA